MKLSREINRERKLGIFLADAASSENINARASRELNRIKNIINLGILS